MTKAEPELARPAREASAGTLYWGLTAQQAWILAAIVAVTIAIYLPSLRNGWVFDDSDELVNNKLIHSWSFVWNSFRYDVWWFREPTNLPQSAYYRPIENTWFAANALLFGMHPAAWHLAKVLLHAVAVILCFRVAQLLTGEVAVALLAAAIFGVIPAHVGGVVFASAIPEPLSTAFELGALSFLIGRKPGWSRELFIALILYACATLTHESAILFPLIVFAYGLILEGGDESGAIRRIVSALRLCAPFVLVAIAYLCARLNALGWHFMFGTHYPAGILAVRGFVISKPHYSPVAILMTLPEVLLAYLGVLTLPAMAGPTHALEWITQPEPIVFIKTAVLLLIAAAAFILAWRSSRRRIYLFCAIWSLLTIAPALNLNALWWLAEDRFLYAPSFGWSLAFALAAYEIAAIGATARKAVGVAMAALLVLYAGSTIETVHYWHDDVTFFQRCVEIDPHNPDYRLRLAGAMNKAGNPDGAVRELLDGIALDPDEVHLHFRLAQQYKTMGRELEFEQEFMKFNQLSQALIERQRAAQAAADAAANPP
jgi:protein O-mannosyl-transferase